MEKNLNNFFRSVSGKKEKDYVLAVDTDSVYLVLDDFVSKFNGRGTKTSAEIVGFLDKTCQQIITPEIKWYNERLANYVNAKTVDLDMKRESICDKTIWTAKKRYILSVVDQEGVRYDTPQIKMSGIEAVKSSTPEICRKKIKEAIEIILTKTESDVHEFVQTFKREFKALPIEDISFPRGVNNLDKYSNTKEIYKDGTPIHVKGALIYNHYLKKNKLDKKYPLIREGEKIRFSYVKTPNPYQITVISFPGVLPKELSRL
jgi:DNA polymerase elongation subunit (family B)